MAVSASKSKRSTSEKNTKPFEAKKRAAGQKSPPPDASGLIDYASNIVSRAATILEEEIAKGIVAAKQLEGRLTDVEKLRSPANRELISRFRKDAHDIVDILMDVATVAVKNAGNPAAIFSVGSKTKSEIPAETLPTKIPLIKIPGVLIAGKPGLSMPITLENDSKTDSKTIHFENTALVDQAGGHIASTAIKFEPNPLTLAPGESGQVVITLTIPKKAKAGSYTCFIQARNMDQLKATLQVDVAVN